MTAELLLGALLAEPIDHRRPGDEHRRHVLHHQRVVAGRKPRRAKTCDRAKAERDDGHQPHVLRTQVQARGHCDAAGQVRVTLGLDRLDRAAAARTLDHADDRHAELGRHLLGHLVFCADRCVRRAAAHGKIVAKDHHRAVVDLAAAEHAVAWHEVDHVALLVVLGLAGHRAELVERAGIEHLVDALAHREPATGVLALDTILAAHLLCDALALGELVEFPLPADLFLGRRHAAVHVSFSRMRQG